MSETTTHFELVLEFRQFPPLEETRPNPIAHSIQKNPAQNKFRMVSDGDEGGAKQWKWKNAVVPDSILERTLGRSGIRIGAYEVFSSHHARGACTLVRLLFEKGSRKAE